MGNAVDALKHGVDLSNRSSDSFGASNAGVDMRGWSIPRAGAMRASVCAKQRSGSLPPTLSPAQAWGMVVQMNPWLYEVWVSADRE